MNENLPVIATASLSHCEPGRCSCRGRSVDTNVERVEARLSGVELWGAGGSWGVAKEKERNTEVEVEGKVVVILVSGSKMAAEVGHSVGSQVLTDR